MENKGVEKRQSWRKWSVCTTTENCQLKETSICISKTKLKSKV